jgi:hypothetical protein
MIPEQSRCEPVVVFSKTRDLGWIGLWRVGGLSPSKPKQDFFNFEKSLCGLDSGKNIKGQSFNPQEAMELRKRPV